MDAIRQTLAERIEYLEKRDATRELFLKEAQANCDGLEEERDTQEALKDAVRIELAAANAKIALLRAALEPMVADANAQDQRNPHASGHIAIGKFTIDQCRAARTAYEATK